MRRESDCGNGMFQILKGAGIALAFSLFAAVIFANVLQFTPLPDKVIYPVNQTLKAVAVAFGTLIAVRGEKGFLKGVAIALLFTALSYLAFSAIGGDFSLSWLILVEIGISALIGAVSGAVAVNVRKSA